MCGPHSDRGLTPDGAGARGRIAPRGRSLSPTRVSNCGDVLLSFREKLKMKEREEAWVKIENLAKANPQVLSAERGAAASRVFVA